ncbi:MAG: AAA family ATPase [Clostridia bacterium]
MRVIALTSGKGGVGKTTITANLARSLAKLGNRVVIVDMDTSLANLDLLMVGEEPILFDIIDCINHRCRVKQALIQDKIEPSLYFLPCLAKGYESNISLADLKELIDNISTFANYVLLDCPAGVEQSFSRALSVCEEAIIICTPHLFSIKDSNRVLLLLGGYAIRQKYILVNRVRADLVAKNKMLSPIEIFSLLSATPLGIIPELDELLLSVPKLSAYTTNVFDIIADNLHNSKKNLLDFNRRRP